MFAFGALVYLELSTAERQRFNLPERRPVSPPVTTNEETVVAEAARLTLRLQELDMPVPLPAPKEEQIGNPGLQWTHRTYEVALPRPRDLEPFTAPVLNLRAERPLVMVHIEDRPQWLELRLGVAGLRTHTLRYRWLERPPRASLFVTGLGRDLVFLRQLLQLPGRITYAIDPAEPFADIVAERVKLAGAEAWLQVDLRATNPAAPRPETQTGPPRDDTAAVEIEPLLGAGVSRIPSAQGALILAGPGSVPHDRIEHIHTMLPPGLPVLVIGSPAHTRELCAPLRERKRPCLATAAEFAEDAPADETSSRILKALARAQLVGDAIEILKPSEPSLAALKQELPRFAEAGIELVDGATIVRTLGLSQPPSFW